MRLGVGVALVLFGASSAAAEAVDKKSATKAVKVAAAIERAGDIGEAVALPPVTRKAKPVAVKRKPVAPTLVAKIDLNAQRMRVTANGKLVGSWRISSGKWGHETPPGRFRPQWSSKMHYSKKYYNSPMPYSVFFNGGIATHGTNHNSMLGRPASHGCIRLQTSNARKFYQLVHRHGYKRTRIIVKGKARTTRTRTASRRSPSRRNSFATPVRRPVWNTYSSRRYSLREYDRHRAARHQQRVRRYYQSRKRAYRTW